MLHFLVPSLQAKKLCSKFRVDHPCCRTKSTASGLFKQRWLGTRRLFVFEKEHIQRTTQKETETCSINNFKMKKQTIFWAKQQKDYTRYSQWLLQNTQFIDFQIIRDQNPNDQNVSGQSYLTKR